MALTGLALVRTNEVGDPGTTGRYQGGLPIPYGSGSIDVPTDISQNDAILWLANALAPKMNSLRECGAEDIYFSIGLFHDGQCNWSLSAEEFKAMAALDIDMHVSAYEESEPDGTSPIQHLPPCN